MAEILRLILQYLCKTGGSLEYVLSYKPHQTSGKVKKLNMHIELYSYVVFKYVKEIYLSATRRIT